MIKVQKLLGYTEERNVAFSHPSDKCLQVQDKQKVPRHIFVGTLDVATYFAVCIFSQEVVLIFNSVCQNTEQGLVSKQGAKSIISSH